MGKWNMSVSALARSMVLESRKMHVKATLILLLLAVCSMACQPEKSPQDEQAFRLGLAEDYRFRESMVAGIPFIQEEDTLFSFLEEGDLVLRFNSAHCMDCLKPIFEYLQTIQTGEIQSLYLIGSFDSDLQFKSYLKKQNVDHLKHLNIPSNSFSAPLEALPGPYLFRVGKQHTASRTFILDKYFQELNLRYLTALIKESQITQPTKESTAP